MRTRQQTRLIQESSGIGEHDADGSLVLNEEGNSVISTQDTTPQRKKRALANVLQVSKVKRPNKIKGKLSGILSLPVEVFMEIITHVALPDVLSLSRSNKFFRRMLMTRSATTLNVWRQAVENVPGLPPCPEGICEPQYAALIYTKHCSMCGAKIVKDMDPYLNVRICKDCVEIHVTHVDGIDYELRPLVPRSKITRMKASRYGMKTCLVRDAEQAQQWLSELPVSDVLSDKELDAVFQERLDAALNRIDYAKQMVEFLHDMAKARKQEIDQLKEQRRQDIKRRLKDVGWEERDWMFPEFVARKWSSLVEAPQVLTDRAWQKLYPNMVPYLEQNREWQTKLSKLVRKGKRLRRMRRLLLGIRNQSHLLDDADGEDGSEDGDWAEIDFSAVADSTANNTHPLSGDEFHNTSEDDPDGSMENNNPSTPTITHARVRIPFPPMVDLLEWPIISNLLKADTDADTMQERFGELREEIEDEIHSWGSGVEEELVGILETGLTEDAHVDSNVTRLQLQNENTTLERLTPASRLLLRADSIFRISEENGLVAPMPVYFPEVFSLLQSRPSSYCTFAFKRLDGRERPKHGYTWDPSEVEYYPEGSRVAKALLKELGRVNAAQFELQALGARFTCGSCGDKLPRSWNEIVQHYAEAIIHANLAEKAKSSVKKRVKYTNTHSLDPKAKHKSLIVLHSAEEAKALSSKRRKFENLVRCKSCEELGVDFQSPRDIMLKHVRTVHVIKAPKAEHYERTREAQKHVKVFDPTGNVSESTEATDQEFVKKMTIDALYYAGMKPFCPKASEVRSQGSRTVAQRHRQLADESCKQSSEFLRAAPTGVNVMINLTDLHCDALVLIPYCNAISHVPLPGVSKDKITAACNTMHKALRYDGIKIHGVEVDKSKPTHSEGAFKEILELLWITIAHPILDSLGYIVSSTVSCNNNSNDSLENDPPTGEFPRLTWYVAGRMAFLPLHAAGCYDRPRCAVSDFIVSSYTPTLSVLLSASPALSIPHSRLLVDGQYFTPSFSPLPGTRNKLAAIDKHAKGRIITFLKDSFDARLVPVPQEMESSDWIHFACHSIGRPTDPTESCFYLQNKSLSLKEILHKSFRGKGLAFLSGCNMVAEDDLANEAVPLASGMLMAGYQSMIASMWAVVDLDAPILADQVYERSLKDGRMDYRDSVRALHAAVNHLRDRVGYQDFIRWVPYIHVGS
ncbi:CHAT domain-containing protein [Rhizoctonia solani]|nr:CHAT domain-containing protein [Rhizoctonia solani]